MFHECAGRFDVMGNLVKFWVYLNKALVCKKIQDSPSHRIFGRVHRALNINKNKN